MPAALFDPSVTQDISHASVLYMLPDKRVLRQTEVHELLRSTKDPLRFSERRQLRILRIQYQDAAFTHAFGNQAFDPDNVLNGFDSVLTDVIQLYICYYANIGPIVAETGSKNSAACGLQYRGLDRVVR